MHHILSENPWFTEEIMVSNIERIFLFLLSQIGYR